MFLIAMEIMALVVSVVSVSFQLRDVVRELRRINPSAVSERFNK